MTIDERFTDFTDAMTERMGNWRASAFGLLAILCWGVAGPFMHYSDSWQLDVNTPTTIIEFFLSLWQLAASNRIEKHIINLLEAIEKDIHTPHQEGS